MSFKTLLFRRAIVGAPLSDSTGTRTQEKNGAVYRCHINGNSGCINMGIDDSGKFCVKPWSNASNILSDMYFKKIAKFVDVDEGEFKRKQFIQHLVFSMLDETLDAFDQDMRI